MPERLRVSRRGRSVVVLDRLMLAVTGALAITVALGIQGPPRWLPALVFVTFVPGWAVTSWLGAMDWPALAALSCGLSLAICALTATVMLWLQVWRPSGLLAVLVAASGVSIGCHLVRTGRPQSPRFDGRR